MKMPLFRSAFAATIAAFAALVLAAAPAWAGSQPQGALDECYGKTLAVHVKGWTYDPDVSSQSTGVQVYLYADSGCTRQYGDVRILAADRPRSDVNRVKGVEGDHGFDADIPVPAGTYWVKVFAVDATGDGNLQVGTTRSVTVAPRLPGSGTPADPYRISSAADWNIFASNISAGFDSNSCYRLGADIGSVTVPVGTAEHPFAGTFDGGSNTLTVALSGSDRAIAPFFRISGATIRNLKVAGEVSGAIHCSGRVGEVVGGQNVIDRIARVQTDRYDRPLRPVKILRIRPNDMMNRRALEEELRALEEGIDLDDTEEQTIPDVTEEEPIVVQETIDSSVFRGRKLKHREKK